jgi:glucose-6-phosphate isomerase
MKVFGNALSALDENVISELNLLLPRISEKDPKIWGNETEAKNRLGWVDLPFSSRNLLPQFDALSAWVRSRGLTHLVLCGMGGSSLAAEVIANSESKLLTIIDSTDPDQIRRSIPQDLEKSLIIIASKSGTTIETISHFKFFEQLFLDKKLDPVLHLIVLTDPKTDLNLNSRRQGYKVFETDLSVGGRFSALSAFGLLPASLLGIDVSVILDDAQKAHEIVLTPNSPAVLIATALFQRTQQFVTISRGQAELSGLGDWIEQLIAESTGKNQTGRLPIVSPSSRAVSSILSIGFKGNDFDITVEATLGEHFVLWEWITVLLCYLLKVDPFDQPNVSESKQSTLKILDKIRTGTFSFASPQIKNESFDVYTNCNVGSIDEFLEKPFEYLAVMAFLPRYMQQDVFIFINKIASKLNRPITFGWGPRFLHSTGQFHKGGNTNGGFIQITRQIDNDLNIPSEDFTFGQLITAQALGDAESLTQRSYPVFRIHLKQDKGALLKIFS